MRVIFLLIIMFSFCANNVAQSNTTAEEKQAAYLQTITTRAQKIVATLTISDSSKFYHVQSIIAKQYSDLNDLHTRRDEAIKPIKNGELDKETKQKLSDEVSQKFQVMIDALHKEYLARLSKELSEEQVTKVKDGMTYNVVNITYKGYLDMLPNLTADQKKQIMAWLVEAREHAMDAESSEKKHGWFGKYKGRINNYLAAAGYDLKKEGDAWQKRIKEKEQNKNAAKN